MGRIAPDSNDVFVLLLNETDGTYVNTGTAGTAGNWESIVSPIAGAQGLFNDAVYIPGLFISPNHDTVASISGSEDIIITPNISMSCWVFVRKYPTTFGDILLKQYFAAGWGTPFLTFGMQFSTSQDGSWDLYITTNGVLNELDVSSNDGPIPLGRWCHLGGTWDGTTLRAYINGSLVDSTTFTGTIDYGTAGSRGKWCAGGIPDSGTVQSVCCILQDIRIADVVRPQSYFANIYYNGFTP